MLMNIMPILSRRRSAGIRHNIAQFCQAAPTSPVIRGRWPAGPEGEGLSRGAFRIKIMMLQRSSVRPCPPPPPPRRPPHNIGGGVHRACNKRNNHVLSLPTSHPPPEPPQPRG